MTHPPRQPPAFLLPGSPLWFPDPRECDADGLLAVGADLSPDRLLHAYDHGIFPWYDDDVPPLWWSPDPRGVIVPDQLHVSRRLARRMRQGTFRTSWNTDFRAVIVACGEERPEGTWVIDEMVEAYVRLHDLGHAHSVEVWNPDDRLVGGVYGVHRGGFFAAESMFHRETDASKVALVTLVQTLAAAGVELIDAQMPTDHLMSMGAETWSRERYLGETARLRDKVVTVAPG